MDWLIICNIVTIVIIHVVNHSYNLSFFSINIKMFSLFLYILCSKREETPVFIKKTNSSYQNGAWRFVYVVLSTKKLDNNFGFHNGLTYFD